MFLTTLSRLWRDQAGSVLATEYMLLGSIVALGGAAGLTEMRDSTNAEYREYGNTVRQVRQQYTVPATKSAVATTGGASVFNPAAPNAAP